MTDTCSVCGASPALCVDAKHKGTYFLCGECMGERIEDKIAMQEQITELEHGLEEAQHSIQHALVAIETALSKEGE